MTWQTPAVSEECPNCQATGPFVYHAVISQYECTCGCKWLTFRTWVMRFINALSKDAITPMDF